jgi:hypothetical protein
MIQRDYAQGRVELAEIRSRFLKSIFEALMQNIDLELDFVYGSILKGGDFMPNGYDPSKRFKKVCRNPLELIISYDDGNGQYILTDKNKVYGRVLDMKNLTLFDTKYVLAIIGVAVVAAALVGVTTAQLIGAQNTTNPAQTGVVPPCYSPVGGVPPSCVNATTGQPYCYGNGADVYRYNGTAIGYCQNGGCYGYGYAAQNQNQNTYGYGAGMMGRSSGYGRGCHP